MRHAARALFLKPAHDVVVKRAVHVVERLAFDAAFPSVLRV
jgi:hypothetical protein